MLTKARSWEKSQNHDEQKFFRIKDIPTDKHNPVQVDVSSLRVVFSTSSREDVLTNRSQNIGLALFFINNGPSLQILRQRGIFVGFLGIVAIGIFLVCKLSWTSSHQPEIDNPSREQHVECGIPWDLGVA